MTLDNLLRIGKLKPHAADKVEIGRLFAAAGRALTDAGLEQLSSDARLDLAYRAIMQAALAAMLAGATDPLPVSLAITNSSSRRYRRPRASPLNVSVYLMATGQRGISQTTAVCPFLMRSRRNAWRRRVRLWMKSGAGLSSITLT